MSDAMPAARDRYVDFLRAASILVVVVGHWLMAVVTLDGTRLDVGNLIAHVDGLWAATWMLQVMPIFFFVGGFVHSRTLDALGRRGAGYATFAAGRVARLLGPVWVLLAVWLPLIAAAQALNLVGRTDLVRASVIVTQLLWFIGIYLLVIAVAPPLHRLHRRIGWRVLVVLAALSSAVDVARFALDLPLIGLVNFALVWAFIHQLGFFYADGALPRLSRTSLGMLAAGGLLALILLTGVGPYPRSMVGLPGAPISNMNPPNVCLIALSLWQVAIAMLARDAVLRWLERARPWAVVVAVNAVIMTVLLWHLTALLLAVVILYPFGFPQPRVASVAWWALRPAWLAILAAITFALVLIFRRFERAAAPVAVGGTGSTGLSAIGIALIIAGMLGFAVSGPTDFLQPGGRRLVTLPVSPAIDLLLLIAGVAFLRRGVGAPIASGGRRRPRR